MTTLRCPLEEAATISRHQAAMRQGERIILYSEYNDLADAVAHRLQRAGIQPGDRIALFMASGWQVPVLLTGIMRAGAVACPLSTRIPKATVIERLAELQTRHLIAVLKAETKTEMRDYSVFSPDALLRHPEQGAEPAPPVDIDAPAIMIYTSGTSGRPRPAVLTYGNLYYNARGANANLRLGSKDRWLLQLPLYHVSGLGIMMRCLLAGATMVIPDSGEDLVGAITRHNATHVSIVPTQLAGLLETDAFDLPPGFKAFLVGGSACSSALLQKAQEKRWPLYATYGMTETASQITTMPPDAPPVRRINTTGKALRYRELNIAPDGEILVRGPCVCSGYWQDGAIVPVVDATRWLYTGDLGTIDNEGYLTVSGRKDNLIISGGENIQPEEIEAALMAISGIRQALVVAVPEARYGMRPVAFVQADTMEPAAWRSSLATTLEAFKIPDAFHAWPPDMLDAVKPSRATLAALALRLVG